MFSLLSGVSQCVEQYDAFLVDLWGVVHDGVQPYPHTLECLRALKEANKQVIFISNAPRRAMRAEEALFRMGIDKTLYDAVVTSGELVFAYFAEHDAPFGKNYFIAGPERDAGLLLGLIEYHRVKEIAEADCVIVTGYDEDDSPEAEKMPMLQEAIKRQLPLICANPDKVIVRQSGARALCAGVIAEQYRQMDGEVMYFGKPYPAIYGRALEILGEIDPHRVLAIGDNLETDIAGAQRYGLKSCLVTGGILSHFLADAALGDAESRATLQAMCDEQHVMPNYVVPAFRWSVS